MKTINENLTVEVIKEMGEEIDLYRLTNPMWWTVNIYGTLFGRKGENLAHGILLERN